MLSVFFLPLIAVIFLFAFSPIIDHTFYIEHKLKEYSDLDIFYMIILHIILIGILIYLFHNYIVKNYVKYFKLNEAYVKIIDLILAITLVGIQRNLRFKIKYLSDKHPIRNKLIM
jgi:hypothetical protein